MNYGAIIIGDEIVSGKRRDAHMARVIEALAARGQQLAWCRYLGDDPAVITAALRETLAGEDAVFCFGGIGATPDDHTRQCAAAALGVPIEPHAEALALLQAKFGDQLNAKRAMMADFPRGAQVVPNPYNGIAGFSLGRHFFLPGFPEMAWPMMEWALDQRLGARLVGQPHVERSVWVKGAMESQLIDPMNDILARHPGVKVFSLPSLEAGRRIELGVKGPRDATEAAFADLKAAVEGLGFAWDPAEPRGG